MSTKHFIDPRREKIREIIRKWKDKLNIEKGIVVRFGEPPRGRSPQIYHIVEKHTLILVLDSRITVNYIEIGIVGELIYYMIHYRLPDLLVALILEGNVSEGLIDLIKTTEKEKEQLDKKLKDAVLLELLPKTDKQNLSEGGE